MSVLWMRLQGTDKLLEVVQWMVASAYEPLSENPTVQLGNFMKTFRYESGICKGLQEHVTSTCKMMESLNVIQRSV